METKDFRYGQYYQYDGIIFKHICIYCDNVIFHHEGKQYIVDIKDVEGVPVDEEWLLKFGFEKVEYIDGLLCGYHLPNFRVELNEGYLVIETRCSKRNWGEKLHNKYYVHQLQLLHFALEQKELTIING